MESRIALRSSALPSMQRELLFIPVRPQCNQVPPWSSWALGKTHHRVQKTGTAVCKTPKIKKPHLGEVRLSY